MPSRLSDRLSRRQFLLGSGSALSAGSIWGALPLVTSDGLPDGRPAIVGHRGVQGLEPPNTIAGIRRALELGIDGVELDVRRTRDGKLVLFHDPVLDWATTGHGWIDNTSWPTVQTARNDGEPIPLLADGLEVLANGSPELDLYLDMKADCTEDALELVDEYGLRDRLTVLSFEDSSLEPAQAAGVPTGVLGSVPTPWLVDDAESANASMVLSHYVPRLVPRFVDTAQESGLTAGVWKLADTKQTIHDTLEADPDLLVTNRPDIALDFLD